MSDYQVFVINTGSTSTKVALFEGDQKLFAETIRHDSKLLQSMGAIVNQLPYRKKLIFEALEEKGFSLDNVSVFSARGGGLPPMHAGVYGINEKMCEDAGKGVNHSGLLSPLLAKELADAYGKMAVVVDTPGTDELCDLARITGFNDIYRISRVHALNMKELSRRYAASLGRKYEDLNLVTVHLGGGISVTAHDHGVMIDTVDISNGDGHMAPTRSGFLPASSLIRLCFSGKYTCQELLDRVNQNGGWVDHLGTSDAITVEKMIANGDKYAELIYQATQYEIAKSIGAYATVLNGNVDAILITGGIAYSESFTCGIIEKVKYIADVIVIPGEFEMEALAAGALRALKGEEPVKEYTGEPVWYGFEDLILLHKRLTK